jgi:DNA gyrase subunit A
LLFTRVDEFSRIGRGGQGVIAINTSERNGTLVTAVQVADDHDFFLITNNGAIIRMAASTVSVLGRNTQGVRLIQLSDDRVVGCQVLESIEEVVSAEHENADIVVPLDSEVVDNTSHDE